MTAIYIFCFILMVVGIIFALHLTPEQINKDISQLFTKKESLKDRALSARGKKRKNKLMASLENMRRVLQETGKEKHFSIALMASLLLMVAGSIVAILIDNYFLIPILAVAFAMIPFAYLLKTIGIYESHMREELETALSIVTTSYLRCENITTAVAENVAYLKPPMRGVFETFLAETTIISPDVRHAIYNMKGKIKNSIFEEWCDTLIACQSDRTLNDTLMPVVEKLTDVRLVNNSLKTMLSEARREYYMMVMMVLANIPILYCINVEWYNALMHTVFGKIVLAICGVVILVTAVRMVRLTKPIEYKR